MIYLFYILFSSNIDLTVEEISVEFLLQAVRIKHAELEESNSYTEMECERNVKTISATEKSYSLSKDTLEKEKGNYR